jgi:hypothetical protein
MWGAAAGILAASVTLAALNLLFEQQFSRKRSSQDTTFGGFLSDNKNIEKASSLLKKAKKTLPKK